MTEKGKENSITHFFVTPLLTLVQDVNVAGLLFGSESNSDLARSSNHISVKLHIAWDMLFMSHAILHCLSPSTYPAQSCELASVQRGSLEQLLDSSIHGRAFYGQQQAWEKKNKIKMLQHHLDAIWLLLLQGLSVFALCVHVCVRTYLLYDF